MKIKEIVEKHHYESTQTIWIKSRAHGWQGKNRFNIIERLGSQVWQLWWSKYLEALGNTLGRGGLKRVEVGSAIHNSVTMLIDSPEKRGATT